MNDLDLEQKSTIPSEVLDLLRFMCETWSEIDKWAYENVDDVALSKYPVIQRTSRQIRLINIGAQKYNASNIDSAIKWVLEFQQEAHGSHWIPLDEQAKTRGKILLSYINYEGKRRAFCGAWVKKLTHRIWEDDWSDECDEDESGELYYKEGWYEMIEMHDDIGFVYADQSAITHWMKIPKFLQR